MKILNLGLDNSALNKDSALAKRIVEYGGLVEKYVIVVPAKKNKVVKLSDNVLVYGIDVKNKMKGLLGIYILGGKLIRKESFDVISAQDQYYLGFVALKLARKFKIGLEIQVHGFEKYKGLRKLVAKYIIPRADAVRCVSQRLKKQLISEFGVDEEKIMVAPIHLKLRIKNYELRIKNKDDKFVFLTVGRLVSVKNVGMQIKAMTEVVKKYSNAELWIAGDGEERKKLKLGIGGLGLGDNVKLLGWRDDLEKIYNKADAFLMTSNSEGWGLVVIEAASHGLPVIMTDVGCAGEVIKDEESGIVIPVGGQKKLEEVMVKLIEDKELRGRLGKSAQEAVRKLPSKEETLDLYKESWKLARKFK